MQNFTLCAHVRCGRGACFLWRFYAHLFGQQLFEKLVFVYFDKRELEKRERREQLGEQFK